ncbi:DNA-binding domain-containing protein [Shewanella gelidii]|uniref:Putative DNA-binding domain-containing protein n=1 Tax=Shewanella gelidii TaxID=1642821 RepID=A0A917JWJ7_9GAMM|nr:DNA-binding domain-containing protein [Shewanella gelidii]MCL1098882.1 DNA-binding domain-containing protein [Shewanella gelidii]GGI89681.1 hypothetical protein GCM10009332_28790 [Shewanella gelidii]
MRLKDWQSQFVAAVTAKNQEQSGFEVLVGEALKHRVDIYQGSAQQALMNTLNHIYPVSQQVLGDDCFAQFTRQFVGEYPLQSMNLNHYGRDFSEFMAIALAQAKSKNRAFEDFEYLSDLAKVEWLCHRAYYAADQISCDPIDMMGKLPEARQLGAKLLLGPDIGIVQSHFQLHQVWQSLCPQQFVGQSSEASQMTDSFTERSNGTGEAESLFYCYMVQRQGFKGMLRVISLAEYQLLEALLQHQTLQQLTDSGLDLSYLAHFVANGWIVGFHQGKS